MNSDLKIRYLDKLSKAFRRVTEGAEGNEEYENIVCCDAGLYAKQLKKYN